MNRCLLIDADAVSRASLSRYLGCFAFTVRTGASVHDLQRLSHAEPFDIVLLDLSLPASHDGMDGLALARERRPDAIVLDARCEGFSDTANGVSVRLADGTTCEGDVLVGADGIHSAVRKQLFGAHTAEFTGDIAWRGLIPRERLPHRMLDTVATVGQYHLVAMFLNSLRVPLDPGVPDVTFPS